MLAKVQPKWLQTRQRHHTTHTGRLSTVWTGPTCSPFLRRMASLTRYCNLSRVCTIRRYYRAVQSAGGQPSRRYSCTLPVHHHSGLHPPQGFFKDNDELGFTVTPGKGGRSCNKDQEMFRLIQGTSAEAGLYVNAKKTCT